MYSRGRIGALALAGAVASLVATPATTEAATAEVEPAPPEPKGYGWRQANRHAEQRSRPFALNRWLRGKWRYAELRAMVGKRPPGKRRSLAPSLPGPQPQAPQGAPL